MSYQVIGICSICSGKVVVPTTYLSIYPPEPYCISCGAVEKSNLPIIPMCPNTNRKWRWREVPPLYCKKDNNYLNRPDIQLNCGDGNCGHF